MMHPVLKEALFANWETIVSNMPFDLILNKFNWAFSTDEYESIILESGETSRREQLLLILSQKGDALFYELIKYLQFNEAQQQLQSQKEEQGNSGVDGSFSSYCTARVAGQSEIVRSLVGHIEYSYEIQGLKNVKWHGLCSPNVRYVRCLPVALDMMSFDQQAFTAIICLDPAVQDQSVDNLAQWGESFCWVIMKRNPRLQTPFCVVYHEILTCTNDYSSILFDLFLFLTRKCSDFLPMNMKDLHSTSSLAILSWMKNIAQTVKIVLLLGSSKSNDKALQLLHGLRFAGISVVLYSLESSGAADLCEKIEKRGLECKCIVVDTNFDSEDNLKSSMRRQNTEEIGSGFGAINYADIIVGDRCQHVYEMLSEKVQIFLKQCAVLKNRILYVKVIKCLWKFVNDTYEDEPVNIAEMHQTMDLLINHGVMKHFLGSYFLSPSMKVFLLKKSRENSSELKVLNQNLLQAYLEKYKTWSSVPSGDIYFQQYYLRHLIKAGGHPEALNLFTNLEWILLRCTPANIKCFIFDLNRLVNASKFEDREPLHQLLKIIEIVLGFQTSESYEPILLAYIVSSFCNKMNNSGSLFAKFFESLPAVLNNDRYWLLPINNSMMDPVALSASELERLPLNSKVIFSDLNLLLFSFEERLVLANRVTFQLESTIVTPSELKENEIAVVTQSKDREFQIVAETCELYEANFITGQISYTKCIHDGGKIVNFTQIFDKFLVITVHEDLVLNVVCSVTLQTFASVSLKSNGDTIVRDCPMGSLISISCAITDSDTLIVSAILNCNAVDPQCVVYEYDCQSQEIVKLATVALNSPVQFSALSTSCDLVVCFTPEGVVDLYSIGSETFMKTVWSSSVSKPTFFHRTKRGLYLFGDKEGNLEVCSLEGEAQITPMWSHTFPVASPISQFFIGSDDDTISVVYDFEEWSSCHVFQLSKVIGISASSGSKSSSIPSFAVQKAYLNADGSLIYSIALKRMICEATDTLNPVQIYSLNHEVTRSAFVDDCGFSAIFLFYNTKTFAVLKCPSFETIFESSAPYDAEPLFMFFQQHLLFLIFEDFTEIWDCFLHRNVVINVALELSVEDAYVDDDKLYLLLSNASTKVINLHDMTWDILDPISSGVAKSRVVLSQSLNECFLWKSGSRGIEIASVFNSHWPIETTFAFESGRYECLHLQALPHNLFAVLLNDSKKAQLIVPVLTAESAKSDFREISSRHFNYESLAEQNASIKSVKMFALSPDAENLLCIDDKNQLLVLCSSGKRSHLTNFSQSLLSACPSYSHAAFVSSNNVFAAGCEGQFLLIDVELSEIKTKIMLPDAGSATVVEIFCHPTSGDVYIVSCDLNGLFLFWSVDQNCLNLILKREHSSSIKVNSVSYFGLLNSTIYFICLTEEENALIWNIETDQGFEVSLCDQCQAPAASLATYLDVTNYTLSFLREDCVQSLFDVQADSWKYQFRPCDRFHKFRCKHRFLGLSGLVLSVSDSGAMTFTDSISQRLCAQVPARSRADSSPTSRRGGKEPSGNLVDVKVHNEKCLIYLGFKNLLEIWSYNEESLLLNTAETLTDCASEDLHKLRVQLHLQFDLDSIVVCSQSHSVLALIDKMRGSHHLIELYNRQLTNENSETKSKSFYFSKGQN
ncbi:uncharacterized protein LOC142334623 isoform X2 [Convolutriloba macropyga]|uniref:uncharacterized protein LOC142334623 isoform X2 n=1 Tax=Convolutriloba macropyga TaxID=536237 RepID=UPI003F520C96